LSRAILQFAGGWRYRVGIWKRVDLADTGKSGVNNLHLTVSVLEKLRDGLWGENVTCSVCVDLSQLG
jgi:hypothetical protein